MAKRLIEIIAIAKGDKGKIFVAKKNRYYLESQVIKMVKQGYIFEVQNESGISTYFMVKKMKSGKEYLSTVPDQTERNNLKKIKSTGT